MICASMKGKLLHLYEHSHQAKLQTLEHVVQTPPDGSIDHDDLLCSKLSFDTRMQQGLHVVEVTFIPTIWVPHFIVDEEGQDGGQCQFLCKKHFSHLDNDLQHQL
jgi:hypothetical protein